MRFTFLGTGTSAGIPAIACGCAVCMSTDPRDNRLRTGAALEFVDRGGNERVVLIDATPDLRQQALRAGLKRCDAVLFTHNHVDHTFGLDEVRRFNAVQGAPIDIYAESHTLEHLRRVYQHVFDAARNVNQSFVAHVIAHEITVDRPLDLFGLRVTPLRLLHGRLPVVGYRFELSEQRVTHQSPPRERGEARPGAPKDGIPSARAEGSVWEGSVLPLAYCTDVSAIPPESWKRLRGLNTLVLDALRHRRHPTHFTLEEAVNAAANIGAARTFFVHMAHDLGHAATDASLPEGMHLAYDGLALEDV